MTKKRSLTVGLAALSLLLVIAYIKVHLDYSEAQRKPREAVLRENLQRMREVIDQYYQDKEAYPSDLQTLVNEGYFRRMPIDPFTRRDDTWILIKDRNALLDVKSGATGTTLDGIPYNEL